MTFSREAILRAGFGILALLAASAREPASEEGTPLEQAQRALAGGDGLGAEIALRRMLEGGAPVADLAAYLGEAELLQGQLAEARHWLGEGQFAQASAAHGYHMLGRLEMQAGNLVAAGQAFDQSWRIEPENAGLWVDIGRLRFRGGEQAQAIEASKRAIELDPDNPRALQFRAQLVRDAEGLAAAVPWLEAALERNPDDTDLLGDYAATLGDMGRASEMLAVVRRMAELDPREPRIFYLQAVLAARAGRFDLARSLLGHLGSDMAGVPAVILLSGVVDLENGNHESAAQSFDRLATMQPDNRRVRHLLARALALGLHERELVHRLEGRARSRAAAPYLAVTLARTYEALGERDRAAGLLDAAAAGRGDRLAAMAAGTPLSVAEVRPAGIGENALALVRGRIAIGRNADAVREADAFVRVFPGSSDALALAGDAHLAAGQIAPALERYEQAAAIRRTWPLVRRMVAAYRASGQSGKASALLTRHLSGDPQNAEAAVELARVAMGRGDLARAATLLEHALMHGSERDPAVWAMRSIAAQRAGQADVAFDAIVRAHALQPMRRDSAAALSSALAVKAGEGRQ